MDASEVEENLFTAGDAKLHRHICRRLSAIVGKVLEIFPVLEAARPRSKSGIQSLCSVHVALDKAKNLLQHCSNCSKLYLAITGDSILSKFEKARVALQESLRRVEDIVPQAIGFQIMEIVRELEGTTFALDESEKRAGDDIIQLLQKEKDFNGNSNDIMEIEIFHQAALQLGITSSRAALTERRALKKLIEKARREEDKRKESIVAYFLHLMRKYSKLFRNEITDDTDSQGSSPCSPTVKYGAEDSDGQNRGNHPFEKQISRLSSFSFKSSGAGSGSMPVPPSEFRCPISLQLMYDPVIISSGQTYERACIEKWFHDGHHTCPKTQQVLAHRSLTPNYCVKGLITSWCEQHGLPVPKGPPDSLDLNYWRLALSEHETADPASVGSIDSCKLKNIKVIPLKDSQANEEVHAVENASPPKEEIDEVEKYDNLLACLYEGETLRVQQQAVERIRFLLKDDVETRIYMGANGFSEGLVRFLKLAVEAGDENAQEVGTMALFNLAVNNNRNKGMLLSAGVIPLLEEMISNSAYEAATALYLNLSCFDDAKPIIGSSKAVPFLVQLLGTDNCKSQCRADALHTLYTLSTHQPNIPFLLSAGIINSLHSLITGCSVPIEGGWADTSIAVLVNIASDKSGKNEIILTSGLIGAIAAVLDTGELSEQEQAVSCLLFLCNGDQKCCHLVLQEGVIPALVSMSINGTPRGRDKAQKLLHLFREHRQRDTSPAKTPQRLPQLQQQKENSHGYGASPASPEPKPMMKSASKRRVGRTLTSLWKKNKQLSLYQC